MPNENETQPVVVGSGGQYLELDTKFDFTGYTELQIEFMKPDGATVITKKTADGVAGTPATHKITYTIPTAFWTEAGIWLIHATAFMGATLSNALISFPPTRVPVAAKWKQE